MSERLKKILCATDFSRRSDVAIDRAAALARSSGAELLLLHVVDDDEPQPMVEERVAQARTMLLARAAHMMEGGAVHANIEILTGSPFTRIVEVAHTTNVDLIVMGAPRRRLLRDVVIGTTTERVLRTGHHPVLVANVPDAKRYESVLAALDASEVSARALRVARNLGLLEGAHVSVVHAFEPVYKGMMSWAGLTGDTIAAYSESWARDTRMKLQTFLESIGFGAIARNVLLEEGPPFASIKSVVERTQPQLLVIGTRGLSGLKRLLLGSVADRVLTELDCDVLAVPPLPGDGH